VLPGLLRPHVQGRTIICAKPVNSVLSSVPDPAPWPPPKSITGLRSWAYGIVHRLLTVAGSPGRGRRQGNHLQRLPRQLLVARFHGEVAQRDDPDQALVPVEDDQAADLMLLHQPGGFLHVLILEAVNDSGRHHVPHLAESWR